jgi:hypothetical protein
VRRRKIPDGEHTEYVAELHPLKWKQTEIDVESPPRGFATEDVVLPEFDLDVQDISEARLSSTCSEVKS